MHVALASTNRAKLSATQAVVARIFPHAEVHGVLASVDVPAQPIGDEATQAGAIARARATVNREGVTLGIGLEGGLRQTLAGWALCSWAAVVDTTGTVGLGGGGILLLPPAVVERVLRGAELGPLMDELAQASETRHGLGASGVLSGGHIDRAHIFEDALICALVPWLHPAFERRAL